MSTLNPEEGNPREDVPPPEDDCDRAYHHHHRQHHPDHNTNNCEEESAGCHSQVQGHCHEGSPDDLDGQGKRKCCICCCLCRMGHRDPRAADAARRLKAKLEKKKPCPSREGTPDCKPDDCKSNCKPAVNDKEENLDSLLRFIEGDSKEKKKRRKTKPRPKAKAHRPKEDTKPPKEDFLCDCSPKLIEPASPNKEAAMENQKTLTDKTEETSTKIGKEVTEKTMGTTGTAIEALEMMCSGLDEEVEHFRRLLLAAKPESARPKVQLNLSNIRSRIANVL